VTFNGLVGSGDQLAALTVTGSTTINASAITTSFFSQIYSGAVTLGTNTTLISNNLATIVFGSTVDSATSTPEALAIQGASATFNGSVGATHPLASLSLTPNLGSLLSTVINTTLISTTGAQVYNNGAVSFGASANLTLVASSVSIGVGGTGITGGNLTIEPTAGTETLAIGGGGYLSNALGFSSSLQSLTIGNAADPNLVITLQGSSSFSQVAKIARE
jgi:hypothetical protein